MDADATRVTPAPGQPVLWDDLELGPSLGRGGMGEVFRARQCSLDRQVAVKVLRLPAGLDDAERSNHEERFWREARAQAAVHSPHVVQIHGVGRHQAECYLVMELVDGQDLSQALKAGLRPESAQVLDLLVQAATGLMAAWRCGLVHRDFKPSNLMLTRDGQVKLMDFGLAKAADGSQALTRSGVLIGTPTYLSPEQATGQAVDTRSDIYSFGVLAFELACGRPPFPGPDTTALLYQHAHLPPPSPRRVNPAVPRALAEVILTCLAKAPRHRFTDPQALLDALQEARAGRWRRPRRRVLLVAGSAAAGLIAAVLGWQLLRTPSTARSVAPPPVHAADRRVAPAPHPQTPPASDSSAAAPTPDEESAPADAPERRPRNAVDRAAVKAGQAVGDAARATGDAVKGFFHKLSE